MLLGIYFLLILSFRISDGHYEHLSKPGDQNGGPSSARRILRGTEAGDTRPYMVYLRPAPPPQMTIVGRAPTTDPNWLCGGVIIEPRYILTSAACIEDIEHFYVVSGTHKWLPASETNECIDNGAMRAIWKCVPKTYNYDGKALHNILWMSNDIAVVMVAERFNFEKRVVGCDFIPQMVSFNNVSEELEQPGTRGSVAGWGSTDSYSDPAVVPVERAFLNSFDLLEADVMMVNKGSCKNQWLARYHEIIDKHMICGRNVDFEEMSEACEHGEVNCRHLYYQDEEEDTIDTRRKKISERELLQSVARVKKARKARRKAQRRIGNDVYGGFCENDHGGPLTVGAGLSTVVVGIITAYRTANQSTKCLGPFLYTSVWNNRHFIHCAVYKEKGATCRAILRSSSTILDAENIRWSNINWTGNEKYTYVDHLLQVFKQMVKQFSFRFPCLRSITLRSKNKKRGKKKKNKVQTKGTTEIIQVTAGMS